MIFDNKIIQELIIKKNNIVAAIDTSKTLDGTMKIRIKKNELVDIGSHISKKVANGNFIGICKFSKKGSGMLKKDLIKLKNRRKDYYTIAIKKIIKKKNSVSYLDCKNFFWKEIDTLQDYNELKNSSFLR